MALLELDRTDQRDLSTGVSVRDEGVGLILFLFSFFLGENDLGCFWGKED